jgi:hypothetical protein
MRYLRFKVYKFSWGEEEKRNVVNLINFMCILDFPKKWKNELAVKIEKSLKLLTNLEVIVSSE